MSVFWAHTDAPIEPGPLTLSGDEARHLAARRLRPGDALIVFDGRGATATARLEQAGKREARVLIEAVEHSARPPELPVLASAIPKGDRLSTLLQMLTQLGAVVWQPLVLEHSVVRTLDPERTRIRRLLIESAKLARRPFVLSVRPPVGLEAALAAAPSGSIRFGDRAGETMRLDESVGAVLIGPEAGFSEAEFRLLEVRGARSVALAAHNLRIETAVVAAAAGVFAARGSGRGG